MENLCAQGRHVGFSCCIYFLDQRSPNSYSNQHVHVHSFLRQWHFSHISTRTGTSLFLYLAWLWRRCPLFTPLALYICSFSAKLKECNLSHSLLPPLVLWAFPPHRSHATSGPIILHPIDVVVSSLLVVLSAAALLWSLSYPQELNILVLSRMELVIITNQLIK